MCVSAVCLLSEQIFTQSFCLHSGAQCKGILTSPLNWIFHGMNEIKLLAYTRYCPFYCHLRKYFLREPSPPATYETIPLRLLKQHSQVVPAQSLGIEWRCEVISPCSETSASPPPTLRSAYKWHLVLCCTPVTPAPCNMLLYFTVTATYLLPSNPSHCI